MEFLKEADVEKKILFLGQTLSQTISFANRKGNQSFVGFETLTVFIYESIWIELLRRFPIIRVEMDMQKIRKDRRSLKDRNSGYFPNPNQRELEKFRTPNVIRIGLG